MPKSLMLTLALCAAVMLGGCKSESPTGPVTSSLPAMPEEVRGYWKVQSVTVDGVSTPFTEALKRGHSTMTELLTIDIHGNFYIGDYDVVGGVTHSESGALGVNEQNFTMTIMTVDEQALWPYGKRSGQWAGSRGALNLTINDGGKVYEIRYIAFDYYGWDYF
ncbi:hypothetical protein EG829_33495 [bacterium]|nr:hypothetical protein [bacterium]